MQAQVMIDNIASNLGNRNSGVIGNQPVNSVILSAINLAIPHLAQECDPDYYKTTVTISLVAGTREYTLPTLDDNGDTLRIKEIIAYHFYDEDNNQQCIHMRNFTDLVRGNPNFTWGYTLGNTATPTEFSLWDSGTKLIFNYTPDRVYNLRLYVDRYPGTILVANVNEPMPIDDQWIIAIEAYATAHCYLKLQQTQMYQFWQDLYLREKKSINRTEQRNHAHGISASNPTRNINDPLLDPFARSYN
jgi:hypothetical protein